MQGTTRFYRNDDRPFVRFDYTGVGTSKGKIERFIDWIEDACDIFGQLTTGPQVSLEIDHLL